MGQGLGVRGLLVVVIVATATLASIGQASAAWDGDTVKVSVGAVSESDGKVVVTVTSLCDNEIPVSFSTGQRAPSDALYTYRSSYDARGPEANAGGDYQSRSGSLTVSKSKKATFTLSLVDDAVAETNEYVRILIHSPSGTAAFAGDKWACSDTPGDGETYIESAFTIVDDDGAAAPHAVAGSDDTTTAPQTNASPSSARQPAKKEGAREGANEPVATAGTRAERAIAAQGSGAERQTSSSMGIEVLVAALVVLGGAGAVLFLRRRRTQA